jgi:hypothetical protein
MDAAEQATYGRTFHRKFLQLRNETRDFRFLIELLIQGLADKIPNVHHLDLFDMLAVLNWLQVSNEKFNKETDGV